MFIQLRITNTFLIPWRRPLLSRAVDPQLFKKSCRLYSSSHLQQHDVVETIETAETAETFETFETFETSEPESEYDSSTGGTNNNFLNTFVPPQFMPPEETAKIAALITEVKRARVEMKKPLAEAFIRFTPSTMSGTITGLVRLPCLACGGPHHTVSICPYVFSDSPLSYDLSTMPNSQYLLRQVRRFDWKRATAQFNWRMDNDNTFREAILYLRSKFTKRMFDKELHVYVPTKDAPPSAIEYLRHFGPQVYMRSIFPKSPPLAPPLSFVEGYYRTTDGHGNPFVILFENGAHGVEDPSLIEEIRLIRLFVTAYTSGHMNRLYELPKTDARPVSIVVVRARWHTSDPHSSTTGLRCISLGVASEYTWKKGYYWGGIHVGTYDDKLTGKMWWTSSANYKTRGGLVPDQDNDRPYILKAETTTAKVRLLRATLRSVWEPQEQLLYSGIKMRNKELWRKVLAYATKMGKRASQRYGPDSVQAKLAMFPLRDNNSISSLDDEDADDNSCFNVNEEQTGIPTWLEIMALP